MNATYTHTHNNAESPVSEISHMTSARSEAHALATSSGVPMSASVMMSCVDNENRLTSDATDQAPREQARLAPQSPQTRISCEFHVLASPPLAA
jgi:hypothetical protein